MNKVLTPVRRLRPAAPNARLGPIMPEKSSDPAPCAVAATPPHQANAAGETRRVGIEIEFSDVPLDRAAEITADLFGGTVSREAPFHLSVSGTRFGDFEIELDSQYAQPGDDPAAPSAAMRDKLAELVGEVSKAVVPSEITCPPIAFDHIGEIAGLIDALAGAGASGTDASPLYAFGLQLNPEVSALDVAALLPVIRAYMLLSDALRAAIEVDALRALLPFANAFPLSYRQRVVNPDYKPDRDQLIDDYLAANATRNRELDLLPLFAHIDENRVGAVIDDPRIKPRPTYHYRLPNARFDCGGAQLIREWNRWIAVERLAADTDALETLGRAFVEETIAGFDAADWAARTANRLAP